MTSEPVKKRCIAFFDGQNLHHGAKEAFGYTWPNFDPALLAKYICDQMAWSVECVYFYTGIPSKEDNAFWNHFWARKFAVMGTRGIKLYSRELSYSNQIVHLPGGGSTTTLVGREKGIDIRIALDIVRLARRGEFDVALIFSQDQDLSEVADEVRAIAREKHLWIKIASAFPFSPTSKNTRGINGTDWIKISKMVYDGCTDPTDYRPKRT